MKPSCKRPFQWTLMEFGRECSKSPHQSKKPARSIEAPFAHCLGLFCVTLTHLKEGPDFFWSRSLHRQSLIVWIDAADHRRSRFGNENDGPG